MGETRQRPLADHLGLEHHFPDKIPHALADGEEMKVRVLFRLENFAEDWPESPPESVGRRGRQRDEKHFSPMEKCWGSARVGSAGIIDEPNPRYTIGFTRRLSLPKIARRCYLWHGAFVSDRELDREMISTGRCDRGNLNQAPDVEEGAVV